jgi:hypothetical protein
MADTEGFEDRAAALRTRLGRLAQETDACVKEWQDLSMVAKVLGIASAVVDDPLCAGGRGEIAHDDAQFSLFDQASLWDCLDILEWVASRALLPGTDLPVGPIPD